MIARLSDREVLDLWDLIEQEDPRKRALAFYSALWPADPPLTSLDVSSGTINVLRRAGVETVAELRSMDWSRLLSLRGVGPHRARDVRRALGLLS